MRRAVALFLLAVLVACTPEAKQVAATELIVRVSAAADVQGALTQVRMRTAREKAQSWNLGMQKTYEADVLKWPIDFVVVPSSDWTSGSTLELIVDALGATGKPLVQARVLTSFVANQTRIVTVSLTRCGTMALGELCEADADCYGPTCLTCVAGTCAMTPLTSTDDLPVLVPDDEQSASDSGAGMDASKVTDALDVLDSSSASTPAETGASSPDAGSSSVDSGMSTGVLDAGAIAADTGLTQLDASGADAGTCPSGFMRGASGECTDIDECAVQSGGCPASSTCENIAGGRNCACNVGFVKENNSCRDLCAGACDPMATCTAASGTARCTCPAAYTTSNAGKTCTFDASCSLLQCSTNATCTVSGTTRTCTCRTGYTGNGTTCTNTNECSATPPICGDNSTCADTQGSYTCGCQTNYRRVGNACVKNPCQPNPCANGGVCSESSGGAAVCACARGYDGPTCAHNIDDCALNPCQNGGACQDGLNTRSCNCLAPFTGSDCQAQVCTGPISIRSSGDLATYRLCAEIRGNLLIGTAGLEAITANDFPYLTRITGDLQISAGNSTVGTRTPLLSGATFSKLQTVEGMIFVGDTHPGSTQQLRFPELTTIGATADATRRFYFILTNDLSVLDLPKLRTINGSVELRTLAKLCTVNLSAITRVTGNVFIGTIPNAPASAFNTLRSSSVRQGTLMESVIGCCSISDRVSCEEFTSTSVCGC